MALLWPAGSCLLSESLASVLLLLSECRHWASVGVCGTDTAGGAQCGKNGRAELVGVLPDGIPVTWLMRQLLQKVIQQAVEQARGSRPRTSVSRSHPLQGRSAIRTPSRVCNSVIKFRAGFVFNSE